MTCAHGPEAGPADDAPIEDTSGAEALVGYRAAFTVSWRGARMGGAIEELTRDHTRADTLRFSRHERLIVRRGDALVPHETEIRIETDDALSARTVHVTRHAGATTVRGGATRTADGSWSVWFGDEPVRPLPAAAVPAELVALLVAADPERRFTGTAFLPGYGFALAELVVSPRDGARRAVEAVARTSHGSIVSHIVLGADGTVRRMRDANGVSARRVDAIDLQAPFDPPELVDSASVELDGELPAGGRVALIIDDIGRPRPPSLPGQELVIETDSSWHMVLAAGDHGDADVAVSAVPVASDGLRALAAHIVASAGAVTRMDEIAALTRAASDLLDDDLSSAATSAGSALALGRGDCTAHASLFAGLAGARGIDTRLVTGYRIDGARLVRHRWALADHGDGWIAVDPTYGEAPARPRLLGLAVHGAAVSELSVVDTLAFAGTDRARARVLPWHD